VKRSTGFGVAAGAAVMLAVMLGAALGAVALGWIGTTGDGRADLAAWLAFELLAGSLGGTLAGRVCRRVARRPRAPIALAGLVFVVGALEGTLILAAVAAEGVVAPVHLVLAAPFVAAAAVLLGGMRRGDGRFLSARIRARSGRHGPDVRGLAGYVASSLVLFAAAGLALFVLPGLRPGPRTTVVASALTLDLTIAVPAVVYMLLIRTRRLPWLAIVPAFVVGYAAAAATIPTEHQALLDVLKFVVVPLELALVVYLGTQARRALAAAPGGGDMVTRFRAASRDVLGARIPADILTTEVAILYHAFRPKRPRSDDTEVFTPHREVGYGGVFAGLAMALVVETAALHLLVSQWSTVVAWALSFLSAYAVVWLLGDYRAMGARPTTLSATHLSLRVGLRWEVEIPLARIVSVETVTSTSRAGDDGALTLSVIGAPRLRVRLSAPVTVTGMYGMLRRTDEILLRMDDSVALHRRLTELAPGAPAGPTPG